MSSQKKVFTSKNVFLDHTIEPASIVVSNGKIEDVIRGAAGSDVAKERGISEVIDAGSTLIMPGVVDCHVHVNEPGRTHWEGYYTATKAAAAGGTTTIIDMPLNSIPSTTSLSAFNTKLENAKDKCFVDVGFWGGIVPQNQNELLPMLNAGIMGFKCFLIHSGVDEFPSVERSDLERAFQVLKGSDTVVLFHAEVDCNCGQPSESSAKSEQYETFLKSRPEVMEVEAISIVCDLCLKYKVRCHIVHLSSASALPLIRQTRKLGAPLTVETCHHYLALEAETIPNGATQYKCCPPIREKYNQQLLWKALQEGDIDMVVSDHSPCTPDLKLLDKGDFLSAWGGVSSVQFGMSLFWTHCQQYNMSLFDVVRLLCKNTSRLVHLDNRKGAIKPGHDADFVIWDPESSYQVKMEDIQHKNKVTPYIGRTLKGCVQRTVVGGETVFCQGEFIEKPTGSFLFSNTEQNDSEMSKL